jgi:hypothetical protein
MFTIMFLIQLDEYTKPGTSKRLVFDVGLGEYCQSFLCDITYLVDHQKVKGKK